MNCTQETLMRMKRYDFLIGTIEDDDADAVAMTKHDNLVKQYFTLTLE